MAERNSVVALGTFDGLHKGHLSVLNSALAFEGLKPVAVTFPEPPKRLQNREIGMLMTSEEKNSWLKKMGFEIKELKYDAVCDMSPTEYLEKLFRELSVKAAVCGADHRFGKNGAGNAATLKAFCEANGVKAVICPDLKVDNMAVSSSRIREFLKNGELEEVLLLLGRPFSFKTEVVHGEQRGRTIGFPTANQRLPKELVVPKLGVYATAVEVDGKKYAGVTNIGIRPMFQLKEPQSETYICDCSADIYGKTVEITLLQYLREEGHFGSLEGLKAAIAEDTKKAKEIFENRF